MYDFIKGRIDYVCPEYIVVENNGIGYLIHAPNPFVFSGTNEEKKIYVHHYVREDLQALYGFSSREEKKLFIKLLNVTGIGPKGALAVLASGRVDQVVEAIESEDEKFLVKFPGIGKKTARQMILDLKGKLEDVSPDAFPDLFQTADGKELSYSTKNIALEEALLALQALGYSEKEVKKLVPKLEKEEKTTEEYIKGALQLMLK
ncbi:Holliday junction branch migration protein RuvA [Pradoshia sp. D12]|uniref:Holliday junction branch migration protein RuvA n=1 Tax=Bacillaceae TaxID=186817 RepID=UPI00080AD95F|nr:MULTISPECIES: Holliday junction branch migration protein RuvA [Bacillaceae]OCA86525.1 Holliday junction DNA helicase RuvA [Bacillus sp. FJAT-27986]QFK72326.1 Holliday junction branch migration protein RuvA [Pradoshia sp. D12]TPF71181.1 Holliday junction branch migration protein RuvA [Bacillus sp. D12]